MILSSVICRYNRFFRSNIIQTHVFTVDSPLLFKKWRVNAASTPGGSPTSHRGLAIHRRKNGDFPTRIQAPPDTIMPSKTIQIACCRADQPAEPVNTASLCYVRILRQHRETDNVWQSIFGFISFSSSNDLGVAHGERCQSKCTRCDSHAGNTIFISNS